MSKEKDDKKSKVEVIKKGFDEEQSSGPRKTKPGGVKEEEEEK